LRQVCSPAADRQRFEAVQRKWERWCRHPTVCAGTPAGRNAGVAPHSGGTRSRWTRRYRISRGIAKSIVSALRRLEAVSVGPDLFRVDGRRRPGGRRRNRGAFDVTIGTVDLLWRQARREHRFARAAAVREALETPRDIASDLDAAAATCADQAGMRLDFFWRYRQRLLRPTPRWGARGSRHQRAPRWQASGDIAIGDPRPDARLDGRHYGLGEKGARRLRAEDGSLQRTVSTSGPARAELQAAG